MPCLFEIYVEDFDSSSILIDVFDNGVCVTDIFQVPAHLATSPISPSSLSQMEAGLAALKAASAEMSIRQDDPITPVVEHSGTIVTVEDGKVVVSGIPPSGTLLSSAVVDERQYFSDSEVPCVCSIGRRRRQNVTVATQTQITASDVDYIRNEHCATSPGEWYSNLSSTECSSSLESAARRSSDVTVAGVLPSSNDLVNSTVKPDGSVGPFEKNLLSDVTAEDTQFEIELSDDEGRWMSSHLAESSLFGRCASMPSIACRHRKSFDESTDAWAASQYMSTTMNDYTPTIR